MEDDDDDDDGHDDRETGCGWLGCTSKKDRQSSLICLSHLSNGGMMIKRPQRTPKSTTEAACVHTSLCFLCMFVCLVRVCLCVCALPGIVSTALTSEICQALLWRAKKRDERLCACACARVFACIVPHQEMKMAHHAHLVDEPRDAREACDPADE